MQRPPPPPPATISALTKVVPTGTGQTPGPGVELKIVVFAGVTALITFHLVPSYPSKNLLTELNLIMPATAVGR
jgi:hypothetical protein